MATIVTVPVEHPHKNDGARPSKTKPRAYLGHFAGSDVLREGHNVGMRATMDEFKRGTLHSGSKKGPIVKSRKQAIAIGLNQARRGK